MRNPLVERAAVLAVALTVLLAAPAPAAAGEEAPDPSPSAQLEKEHAITLKMLDAAGREAAAIRRTGTLDAPRILKMHDFFSNFVDRCHHAKEERFYFPAARFHDGTAIGDLAAELINEHAYGRTLLQEVAYMLEDPQDADPLLVADRLHRYAELIRAHIGKENEILYRQADLRLPLPEKAGMLQGFARIEKQELGEGFHEKYHALAMEVLE